MKYFRLIKAACVTLFAASLLGAHPLQIAHSAAEQRCFPETGFCISGRIREYWEANGGLPVFGYPIGSQQAETVGTGTFQAQRFERNRLELHPENARPYDVLLGRLGAEQMQQAGFVALPEEPNTDCVYFEQTTMNVCGRFAEAWKSYGLQLDGQAGITFNESLALFGFPLSNEVTMTMPDRKQRRVQYFERARFEEHPENNAPYAVLFGLLGNELRDGSVPQRPSVLLPAPLYFVFGSQIIREERDGRTRTPVVDERGNGDITTLSISADGSAIAYVLKRADGYQLISTSATGANRTEVFSSAEQISTPRWSPDRESLVAHVGNLEANQRGAVYLFLTSFDSFIARPVLPDSENEPRLAYLPDSWSADGQKLLVSGVVKQSEGCIPMLFDLSSEQLSNVPTPGGIRAACGAAWSATGRNVYFSAVPQSSPFSATGLWRINLETQVITPLVRAQEGTRFNLFGSVVPRADGATSTLLAKSERLPQLGDDRPILYAPYIIGPTGAQIRQYDNAVFKLQDVVAWAPDGSGFLYAGSFGDPAGRVRTVWVPLNGGAPYEVNQANYTIAWGR